jgi:tetratricopeptide (TPR) repeat protein
MAQLDRLGFGKEVAQHASVVGPEFDLGLLARVMVRTVDELTPIVVRLVDAHIFVRSDVSSEVYRFRHALIREIAYESLLRKNRRQIHLRAARELSSLSMEMVTVSDNLIAQHYSSGDAHLEAIEFWRRGAGKAIARSANEEAIAMLQSALAALSRLPGTAFPGLELDLVVKKAMALRSLRGYSAAEVEQELAKAKVLSTDSADLNSRFSVVWALFQAAVVRGNISDARTFAADLLAYAGATPGLDLADALLANGMAAFIAGDFATAAEFHKAGAKLCNPEADEPRFRTHGQNTGLFCLSYLAHTQCILGLVDQSLATIRRARSIAAIRATEPGHIHSYLNTTIHAVRIQHLCEDLKEERQLAMETIELASRNQYVYYEALGLCHLGWVTGAEGDFEKGIATLVEGLALLDKTGASVSLPRFYAFLAHLCAKAGRMDEATKALGRAAERKGDMMSDAEIERIRGDIAAVADPAAGEAAYRSSLAIARRQRAGLHVCKATLGLARLLQSQDRHREARDLLGDGLAQLEGGDEVPTIQEARRMLVELPSRH